MTTIVAAAGGGNWSTGATWVGGVAPTSADDAVLASTSGNVTVDGTVGSPNVCKSLSCIASGNYTGTLTHASGKYLNVGNSSGGSFTLYSGMTYSPNATSVLGFVSTTTGNTITVAGKSLGIVNFSGAGGGWTLQDTFVATGALTLTAGTLDTNGQSCTLVSFASTGSTTRTLTLGASSISISGTSGWVISGSNMTLNSNTSTITSTGGNTFTGGGKTYNAVVLNPNGSQVNVTDSNTFLSLSSTGSAAKGNQLIFGANQTITNFTTTSSSIAANRIWVRSSVKGTRRTLSISGSTSASYTDLEDIGISPSVDLSSATGGSGDCGNNSGVTFSSPLTCYWVGTGSVFTNTTRWFTTSGGATATRVPLVQDTAVFDANSISTGSQTITFDGRRMPKIVTTGVLNTPTLAFTSTPNRAYGDIIIDSSTTVTGTVGLTIAGETSITLDTGGVAWPANPLTQDQATGTLILKGNLVSSSTFTQTSGTFNNTVNNVNCTFTTFTSTSGTTRALNLGSGVYTITGTGTVVNLSETGLTVSPGTSKIIISDTSASTKSTSWSNLTFYDLQIAGAASSGAVAVGVNGTFNTLYLDANATVRFTSGGTITVSNIITTASLGNTTSLSATSGGVPATLFSSSTITLDYMVIQDSIATGGGTFYAGSNSTDVSGNSGWIFSGSGSVLPFPFILTTGNMFDLTGGFRN